MDYINLTAWLCSITLRAAEPESIRNHVVVKDIYVCSKTVRI